MRKIFGFENVVTEAGYNWMETFALDPATGKKQGKRDWFLTNGMSAGTSFHTRAVDPLQHNTAPYREFIKLPDRNAMKAFACKYGLLGEPARREVSRKILLPPKGEGVGESFFDWTFEIECMAQVVSLWDMITQEDAKGLSRHIIWNEENDQVRFVSGWSGVGYSSVNIIADRNNVPELMEHFHLGDVLEPALYHVRRVVGDRLKDRLVPRLEPAEPPKRLRLSFVAESLIGLLWLQCAQAIDGNKDYRACEHCGTIFEIAPKAARKSRLYCADACRFRAYRAKQVQAQKLHASGVNIRDIAKQLKTDAKTAKGWVKKKSA